MSSYQTEIERPISINVEYKYHPATRGQRDSLGGVAGAGPALEPDEPAEVEILSVKDEKGNLIELTEQEEADVASNIIDILSEDYSDED